MAEPAAYHQAVSQFGGLRRWEAAHQNFAIKRIARQAHHLTRLRHVAEFFCQIEKADFMPDDFFGYSVT